MQRYIKSISAMNELALSTQDKEVERFSESDIFWAANKKKPLQSRHVRKGCVYQFEFGKNFVPEMSYEHRGLVIGISGRLLYVLPIFSFNASQKDHRDAFHPIDNPTSKSNLFLMKGDEYPFLTHDSVLKLNDIRTVSVQRIKYKQENGRIDPSSDCFKQIEKLVLSKYFYGFVHEKEQMEQREIESSNRIADLERENETLNQTIATARQILAAIDHNDNIEDTLHTVLNILSV